MSGLEPRWEMRARHAEYMLLALAAFAGIALLLWAGRLMGVGLDFSDDGYYLNVNRNPALYSYSVTQFGFLYNPIFQAVGWDVALFRQVGLALTSGLAAVLVALLTRRTTASWPQAVLAGLVFAPVSLTLFYMWLPTPGYNSLGFQGLLLAGIALLLTEGEGKATWLGWVLLGVAGWIVFMAKPTSAAGAWTAGSRIPACGTPSADPRGCGRRGDGRRHPGGLGFGHRWQHRRLRAAPFDRR